MNNTTKTPIEYSYQVTENFFAGEYPFRITQKEGLLKLKKLIDFGITHFIDLTSERLTKYREFLPPHCTYTNLPTIDYTSPDFPILKEIHARIDEAERLGEKIYVHCKGGHDRTGVVVATYFVHAGFSPDLAKQKFYEVFAPPVRGRYSHSPLIETKWEVLEEYSEWLASIETEDTGLKDKILGGILGLAVADAMGVPVEFQSRESLRRNPVTDMRGYGTHNQPPGTWSDDTSLTLCLLESLAKKGFNARWERDNNFPEPDYTDIMQKFLSWEGKGKYTAHGKIFDIGNATRKALQRFKEGTDPLECGGTSENDNGNGSLMRILPLAFYLYTLVMNMGRDVPTNRAASVLFNFIHNVSSLTHANKRSQIACGIYGLIGHFILLYASDDKTSLKRAINDGLKMAKDGWYDENKRFVKELKHYNRIFDTDFSKLPESEIKSSGYVVDTLEAALWCLLNTDNYKDCVLKAVNLGDDTDTVAAVAGGLAGMYYGVESIPNEWLNQLARRDYIEELCENFYRALNQYDGEEL